MKMLTEKELPDGRKDESCCRGVETAQHGFGHLVLAPRVVDRKQGELEQQSRREDAKPAEESAKRGIVRDGEDTQVGGKVEVGTREGLKDGKAEQEVSRVDLKGNKERVGQFQDIVA